ncbi:MAG: hypothetical protein KF847_18630 [Pirellulales bacterium]|nr:hypothetical protein [Pirellulales bacterium]
MLHSARLARRLAAASPPAFNLYAASAAFATYFCMYAFRKPFAAAAYEGTWIELALAGQPVAVQLKTAFVISQIVGYAASKFLGIKVCSEARRGQRAALLIAMIVWAELALAAFAVLPPTWKPLAMLLNGLPLGMVWGLVVQYLEGRRTSEFLLAALSCSYIVSSGVVKDVGRALTSPVPEASGPFVLPTVSDYWMPVVTGAIFLPLFLSAVWLLDHLPEQTAADKRQRTERVPMDATARRAFLRRFLPGLAPLLASYFLLTAFRDFRDNYMVDVLETMGYSYAQYGSAVSRMELCVALVVLSAMASLALVRDNQLGLLAVYGVMIAGVGLLGVATYLHQHGLISGLTWMTLLGTGSYLAYVPYNSLLCDRLLASTRSVGTAVFAIYVADAVGYCGSVLVQLFKDMAFRSASRLEYLAQLSYLVSVVGATALAASCRYFLRSARPTPVGVVVPDPLVAAPGGDGITLD